MSTSTPTSPSNLFSSLPAPPVLTGCTLFCQGMTPIPANFKKVDSLLSQLFVSIAPRLLLTSLFHAYSNVNKLFSDLLSSSLETRGGSIEIKRNLFVDAIKAILNAKESHFRDHGCKGLILTMFATEVIAMMTDNPSEAERLRPICHCTLSSKIQLLEDLSIENRKEKKIIEKFTLAIIKNCFPEPPRTLRGVEAYLTRQASLKTFVTPISVELFNLMDSYLNSTSPSSISFNQFFCTMNHLSGIKILSWSTLLENINITGINGYELLPCEGIITTLNSKRWKEEGGVELLEKMKLEADTAASLKQYDAAIKTYSIISTLIPSVNALANGAALRLRVAKDTDIFQFHFVIIDCSCALELDPNHVKALFRRGLAYCKLKMWNEGIVDFQRAVELDPRSPAKNELAYALRQVGKRIGA